jgi:hypothetical protein
MITAKIIRFLHLLSYLCVTSQVLFYLIVFSDALKMTPLANFLEQRKAVEQIIAERYTIIYLACLILSLGVVFLSWRLNDRVFRITSIVAMLCLVADLSIAIFGNIPINKQIADLTGQINLSQWEVSRTDWLRFFSYRGLFTTAGMLALLIGLIMEKKIE